MEYDCDDIIIELGCGIWGLRFWYWCELFFDIIYMFLGDFI